MFNFGVIEVASTKTTHAPGWAYVPDVRPASGSHGASALLLQPTNRKRAARKHQDPNPTYADLNARQEAKLRKDLDALERDFHRSDSSLPLPPRPGRNTKHTANVRRILQSQKTFANHLDDFIALSDLNSASSSQNVDGEGGAAGGAAAGVGEGVGAEEGGGTTAPAVGGRGTGRGRSSRNASIAGLQSTASFASQRRLSHKKADPPLSASRAGHHRRLSSVVKQDDTEMTDAFAAGPGEKLQQHQHPHRPAALLAPCDGRPPPQPADHDPLLISRVPPLPSEEELRALMAAPPLTYLEARASWSDEDKRYPIRQFCEVCGYWGRVKCIKCGTRLCALDCLDTHREECVTRYGL